MMYETDKPLIPASQKLPEITVKAIIIAMFLTIILTASNAYLALKVGTTIAASIPASILAMGILKFFRNHNVLESNIVQTAASSGEAVVAAISYTLPALLIMHFWTDFHYWEIVLIIIFGGTLGVCFSVPLRRILLADKTLTFPEGKAIGNVLRAISTGKSGLKNLLWGGGVGGFLAFCQSFVQQK
ncbi:MAG: OPT/YSL family transporter [Gammaproteobacteria bacterium]|nr:OPT/YSL family transporter [Gammaproteobacteria bacterium]